MKNMEDEPIKKKNNTLRYSGIFTRNSMYRDDFYKAS